ncbi:MAG TPA: purine nucleoside permease [Acetobacteraceae bacterium]|nr:purine nucleoside permease [Acetobacteraceae bacterium]
MILTHKVSLCLATAAIIGSAARAPSAAAQDADQLPIRVVVVTTFEVEQDGQDQGGEFRAWTERYPLPARIPFPQGYHELRYNPADQVLGIVTGEGTARASASITALGHDPRFDLSHAYWVVAGIAGIDPNVASIGSAAWARYVVDGDLAHEIDAREIPPDWPTGYTPLGRSTPYQRPVPPVRSINGQNVYALNARLVDWAYNFTKDTQLPDDATLQQLRAPYPQDTARPPPVVLEGDTLAASTFWVGGLLNTWAEDWVSYWTRGDGKFATSAEEDAGIMQAITFLAQVRRADPARVLVLRTASNYTAPPPGTTAADLLRAEETGGLSGYAESLEAAYAVASPVVRYLATHPTPDSP